MFRTWIILAVSVIYVGLLFAIAFYGDKRADRGRSLISNPYVYALSLAVYCTSWTFYGSVGRAASRGIDFLPIYLGPTIAAILWGVVLRKMIRISKTNRITSIADFAAARYGKSTLMGVLVTVVAVFGVTPYIALQLKAVSTSFETLLQYPIVTPPPAASGSVLTDKSFLIAILLALFTILFGTRHLDTTERHEGVVAAVAFESIVKLIAFFMVGLFVTLGMFQGPADIFSRASTLLSYDVLTHLGPPNDVGYGDWLALLVLSALAVMLLPRQFQVAVVENVDEQHVKKAIWLFPLYLFVINLFVLPVAFAGLIVFAGGSADTDAFVLTLPMFARAEWLALLAYVGGLSAATSMVIVETIALSTMVCNHLVMPVLLRWSALRLNEQSDLSHLILGIRRAAIVVLVLLGYGYFRTAGQTSGLVSIGLISFAAVAQFAPAILGGMFWKTGNRAGAATGLVLGFLMWAYTLPLPSLAMGGWLDTSIINNGPFGLELLRPTALFGIDNIDNVSHSLMWSMLVNIGGYVGISLITRQDAIEQQQAVRFVDVFRHTDSPPAPRQIVAATSDVRALLARFLGRSRADDVLERYARRYGPAILTQRTLDATALQFVETELTGTVGAASARLLVASIARNDTMDLTEFKHLLDDATRVVAYSHELELKSRELEAVTAELRAANDQLQQMDKLKDEFIATVSHELRTPLTSIRAVTEILHDSPDMPPAKRTHLLETVIKETERLTRLINQMLDLAKIESGSVDWQISQINLREIVELSILAIEPLFTERQIHLTVDMPDDVPLVDADQDRLIQVMLNLLANACKFSEPGHGRVSVRVSSGPAAIRVDVRDNGRGIASQDHERIFEKFRQVTDDVAGKPHGTGLGLPICRQIVARFGGRIWVESVPGRGAQFSFTLPREAASHPTTSHEPQYQTISLS